MKYYLQNPYDYNSVSLKIRQNKRVPTASELVMDPGFVVIGHFLGIWTKADFSEYYDKIYEIIEWAKEKANSDNLNDITEVLKNRINSTPEMCDRRINDLYASIQLEGLGAKKVLNDQPAQKDDNGQS